MRLRDTARSRLSLPPESLAEELSSAAANYGSIVWTLTSGPWTGPSSRSIAAAAPYMTWLGATGEQAQQTATKPQRRPARTKPPSPQQFRRRRSSPTGACWQHSPLRISWGRTLGRPLQLRLTTPRCGAHDAAVVYSYAGASANGVTSDPQPPGPEQRRRQVLRLRCSSPARRHTGCAGLSALGHTVDNAGGQHGRTRGLRFELHSTVIPFTPAAGWPASPGQRSAGWLQTKRGLNSS